MPVNYGSLRMASHDEPISIRLAEFQFITGLIQKFNLKSGYECATAFGVSAVAAGLGFKATGGSLVTMDAYIEEKHNACNDYAGASRQVYQDADGYRCAEKLLAHFELNHVVQLKCGWSPDDVDKVLTQPIDFAFIDAGHFDANLIADIKVINPLLISGAFVLIHDVHCFSKNAIREVENLLGSSLNVVPGLEFCKSGYNLAVIRVR